MIKKNFVSRICNMAFLVALLLLSSCWEGFEEMYDTGRADVYDVGDTGPGGGTIFFINPEYISDGWTYLEAAPADITGGAIGWSDVISGCSSYTNNGYDDWYMPSRIEFSYMYAVLKPSETYNFGTGFSSYYWTADEYDASNAWFVVYDTGGFSYNPKNTGGRGRAIRRF